LRCSGHHASLAIGVFGYSQRLAMGCGASSKQRYNAPPDQPHGAQARPTSDVTFDVDDSKQHVGGCVRSPRVDDLKRRRSKLQVELELYFMNHVPKMYGVSDTEVLREELQEERQAEIVEKCLASDAVVSRALLEQWLQDCEDAQSRSAFITKTLGLASQVDDKKMVRFDVTGEKDGKGILQRKGTGFISSQRVRALVTGDYEDEDDEGSSDAGSEDQDDEEFERQVAANLTKQAQQAHRGSRAAVCAEATLVDADFVPPVYEKTREQEIRLSAAVSESFMFAALSQDQLTRVIAAFQEVRVDAGMEVIGQGAAVVSSEPALFVVESGRLDVFKAGCEDPVFSYTERGQYFGDLALLYNAPRAATVKAVEASVLWAIDRNTFNSLVKDAVRKLKQQRIEFLQSVDVLKSLSLEEIATVADALRERQYGDGVHIITEGEAGQEFYIMEAGRAVAKKDGKFLCEYGPASYFGELALLHDASRAADVITTAPSTVLILGRQAFHRLLGPLDQLMEERAAAYNR